MDDGRHWGGDEHERQCIDASADRSIDPGMLVIAVVVFAGDAGFLRMVRNTDGVVELVVLTVMRNAVRERC